MTGNNKIRSNVSLGMLRRLLAAVLLAAVSMTAFAADLAGAKQSGVIGEREDGYVGFVTDAPAADVRSLVQGVNDQRRAEYDRIAAANGITREQVEALAGRKAIEKTAAGEFVWTGGAWRKKP